MSELTRLTAAELALGIRLRRWSATEALDAHLTRIRERNGELNAVVLVDEEGARRRAREADEALARGELWGPLHGVPVTIKDTLATAGMRTTAGFPPLAEYVPDADATVVSRLRAAGVVLLGKTNTPLLAMNYQCDSPLLGRGNNPWDLERTPGGSTGGGAAAVAACLSPLEIGSDIGGSVRIPAHYCGICSLKPTENRTPLTGHIPEVPGAPRGVRHMASIGPLARSVADLRLALDVTAGPDAEYWESPPVALEPVKLDQPRVAWLDEFEGCPVTADTRRAIAGLAAKLEQAGWLVERRAPEGFSFPEVWETWAGLLWCEVGSTMPPEVEAQWVEQLGAGSGDDDPIASTIRRCLSADMRRFTAVLTERDRLIGALERFLAQYDALLCPVTVGPAIRHCPAGTRVRVDDRTVPYWIAGLAYTAPFNLTGSPVVVLPLGRSAEGLPIGVQVVGSRWQDMKVLALAEAIDRVRA
jgi:amidase